MTYGPILTLTRLTNDFEIAHGHAEGVERAVISSDGKKCVDCQVAVVAWDRDRVDIEVGAWWWALQQMRETTIPLEVFHKIGVNKGERYFEIVGYFQ